jgi:hypothetical protein
VQAATLEMSGMSTNSSLSQDPNCQRTHACQDVLSSRLAKRGLAYLRLRYCEFLFTSQDARTLLHRIASHRNIWSRRRLPARPTSTATHVFLVVPCRRGQLCDCLLGQKSGSANRHLIQRARPVCDVIKHTAMSHNGIWRAEGIDNEVRTSQVLEHSPSQSYPE